MSNRKAKAVLRPLSTEAANRHESQSPSSPAQQPPGATSTPQQQGEAAKKSKQSSRESTDASKGEGAEMIAQVLHDAESITVEQLEQLRDEFVNTYGAELHEREFISIFRQVMSSGDSADEMEIDDQLARLFMKVDTNSDGVISWDEFVNFMFRKGAHSGSEADVRRYGQPKHVKTGPNYREKTETSFHKKKQPTDEAQELLSPEKSANLASYIEGLEEQGSSKAEKSNYLPLLKRVYDPEREKSSTLAGMQLLAIYNSMNFQYGGSSSMKSKQASPWVSERASPQREDSRMQEDRRRSTADLVTGESPFQRRSSLSVRRTLETEHGVEDTLPKNQEDDAIAQKHKALAAQSIVNDIPKSLQLANEGLWSQDQTTEERVPVYRKDFTPHLPGVNGHSDLIVASVFVPAEYSFGYSYDRYITADRSSIVCVWFVNESGESATFKQAFRTGPEQITAMTYMHKSSLLMVGTVACEVQLFELSYLTGSVTKRGTISAPRLQHYMPVSLSYYIRWKDEEKNRKNISGRGGSNAPRIFTQPTDQMLLEIGVDPDQARDAEYEQSLEKDSETPKRGGRRTGVLPDGDEIVLVGDNAGGMHKFVLSHEGWKIGTTFLTGKMASDEENTQSNDPQSEEPARGVTAIRQISGTYEYDVMSGVKTSRHQVHESGWVTKVQYAPLLSMFFTGSDRGEIRAWDAISMDLLSEYGHNHPVMDFHWSPGYRLLGFCSGDRQVILWNPFSRKKSSVLHGHSAPVIGVRFVDALGHIIAFCKDGSVRVWNAKTLRGTQSFRDDKFGVQYSMAESWMPTFHIYPKTNSIVTFTQNLVFWPLDVPRGVLGLRSHPVIQVLYNSVFSEVLTVEGANNSVSNWSILEGSIQGKLSEVHESGSITAAALDTEGRRLFSGTSQGDKLLVSNIHNPGKPLGILHMPRATSALFTTSDRSVTAVISFERVVFPSGGIGDATVAKYVCCARSDGYIFVFKDPSTNDYDGHPKATTKSAGVASGALDFTRPSLDYSSYKSPVQRAKKLADSSVLSQRQRIASRLTVRMKTDSCETTEAQGAVDRLAASSARKARATVHRRDNKRQQVRFNTFDLASGKYADIRLGKLKQETDQVGEKLQEELDQGDDDFVDDDSPLMTADDCPEVPPLFTLPTESNVSFGRFHSDQISSLAFVAPHFIVSAGYDGKIHLWSIITGQWERQLYAAEPQRPVSYGSLVSGPDSSLISAEPPTIEDIVYIPSLNCIVAVGEAAEIHVCSFDDPRNYQKYNAFIADDEFCTSVDCDGDSELLVVGDSGGHVTLWDVAVHPQGTNTNLKRCISESTSEELNRSRSVLDLEASDSEISVRYSESLSKGISPGVAECNIPGVLRPLNRWTVENGTKVTDVRFATSEEFEDIVVLISLSNGRVHLYNLSGVRVGTFGSGGKWVLNEELRKAANTQDSQPVFSTNLHREFFVEESGPGASGPSSRNSNGVSVIPKVGDVWLRRPVAGGLHQRRDTYGLSSATVPTVADDLLSSESWESVTEMITVTRVTTEHVLGWDGVRHSGLKKVWVPLKDFVSPDIRNTDPWQMHVALTARVGRIFTVQEREGSENASSFPFKVRNFFIQRNEKGNNFIRARDISQASWPLPRLLNRGHAGDPDPQHPALQWIISDEGISTTGNGAHPESRTHEALESVLVNSTIYRPSRNAVASQEPSYVLDWMRCMPDNLPPRHWYVYHPLYFLPRRSMVLHQRDQELIRQWVKAAQERVNIWEKITHKAHDILGRIHRFVVIPPVVPPQVASASVQVLLDAIPGRQRLLESVLSRIETVAENSKDIHEDVIDCILRFAAKRGKEMKQLQKSLQRKESQVAAPASPGDADNTSSLRSANMEGKQSAVSSPIRRPAVLEGQSPEKSKSPQRPRSRHTFIKRFERSQSLRTVLAPSNMWSERVQAAYDKNSFLSRKIDTITQSTRRLSGTGANTLTQRGAHSARGQLQQYGAGPETTITGFSFEPKAKLHIAPELDVDRIREAPSKEEGTPEDSDENQAQSPRQDIPLNLRLGVQNPVEYTPLPRDFRKLLPNRMSDEEKDAYWKKNVTYRSIGDDSG
eukprot:gb/GECG01002476.1/.p1 GENE.gb/GECG01002476.1/~~gb/GECG01002476.1/.p1  ORF type:complete len:2076 (+),score=249.76 gb/GECG01002476.1/:1-6228(+)